jgi:predicted ester cyclase
MSLTENKVIARKCFEALNMMFAVTSQTGSAAIEEVVSPMWVSQINAWVQDLRRCWLDYHIEVTDMVAEGNMVWCRLAADATHNGEWEGIPANGKYWTNTGIWYLTIVDRKIVDIEWLFDNLHVAKQLGATITPISN